MPAPPWDSLLALAAAGLPGSLEPFVRGASGSSGEGIYSAPDWGSLGLILDLAGCFLLANGILFRDPRGLVEERFARSRLALRTMRAFLFHRVQMMIGFAFLLAGFSLELFARLRPQPPDPAVGSPALWIGVVVLLAVALEVLGWWWSMHSFRRHLREWFRDHPPDFETDAQVAREVGELFGIDTHADDTVQSYVARVRKAVGLPAPPRMQAPPAGPREPHGLEPDEDED
jgi:hypothetical protein